MPNELPNTQQRTPAWFNARKGKLTASNLGALLGLCTWQTRQEVYNRITGASTFQGNDATEWGCNNEQNAINDYAVATGNVVEPTGLHVHPTYMWIAGSPDGMVGECGMIEVKCPFYKKCPHDKIPPHYYMQMIALLDITKREWCDFVTWTPGGFRVHRVFADKELFDFCLPYWGQVYATMQRGAPNLLPFKNGVKPMIANRVQESMSRVSYDLPMCVHNDAPDSDEMEPDAKRVKLSDD